MRRFVGRWAAKASEDAYVRSALRITENCQRLAAADAKQSFRGGPDFFGEEESLRQLGRHMEILGSSAEAVLAQVARLKCADFAIAPDPLGSLSDLGLLRFEVSDPPESASDAVLVDGPPSLVELELPDEAEADVPPISFEEIAPLLALQDASAASEPAGFVVSVTRGGLCRRLHFVGGCFRVPGEHYKRFHDLGQRAPEEHEYDLRCKDCFPAGCAIAQVEEAVAEMSASDGSASSESSDGKSVAPPPEP